MFDLSRLHTDLFALALFAGVLFLGVALATYDPADAPSTLVLTHTETVQNLAGSHGAKVAFRLLGTLGIGAYLLIGLVAVWNIALFQRRSSVRVLPVVVGIAFCVLAVCVGLSLSHPELGPHTLLGSGGYTGVTGLDLLANHFDPLGVQILIVTVLCAGVVLLSEIPLVRTVVSLPGLPLVVGQQLLSRGERTASIGDSDSTSISVAERPTRFKYQRAEPVEEIEEETTITSTSVAALSPKRKKDEDGGGSALAGIVRRGRNLIRVNPPTRHAGKKVARANETELPPLTILEPAEEFPYELLASKAKLAASTLEKTFEDFNLNVKVVEVDTGPVVTQFELELEAGLRLSKVTALADDLAIALRVPSVRVVAPIPGKNTVGVEVPNEKQVMVRLRELLESCADEANKQRIPIFLGKDVGGQPLAVDMAKMPHLLIAGRTGTGKSVCLNTLICSILMTRTPEEVRMLMIDPKMVELSPYKRVPHLMHPVITDMKKAEAALAWAVDKMEERYDLLARAGVRHLDSYNNLGREKLLQRMGLSELDEEAHTLEERLPYIVIVADEMADMMMTSGKDVEAHIIRLAQKSRAVGIHLVLATQKPTVDVITGLIKSNLPARISFQVASRTDSRVVLDESGADKLLGNGDLLYLAPGTSNLTRAQGTFVSDDEVNEVIEFYADEEPRYSEELENLGSEATAATGPVDSDRHGDELYSQAVEIVVREGRGSVSLLQRCLGIGYGRAARLIDYMADDGIVGDYNGSQAREVLYTSEDLQNLQ